jgi:hypothetical protein
MSLDRYTTLHRKDERGVIVESKVFGPDDEIPEGFGTGDYSPIYAPREDDQEPVAESNLTPWESPVAKGTWVAERPEDAQVDEGTPVQVRDELTGAEEEAVESLSASEPAEKPEDESDEGTPRQAREQGDLTGAEEEADESLEDSEDDSEVEDDESDEGTPRQAREQGDLTGAEEEADKADSPAPPARRGRRKSS